MAQIYYNCRVPGYTADQWNGQVNLGFELSYNKSTNETTINFIAEECFHKYYGINGWGTEATTSITFYAADNTSDKKATWLYTYGYTDGSSKQFNSTPNSITVKHSSAIGAKSVIVEASTTVKVYLKKNAQSTGTGSYSDTVALPASPVSEPMSFTTSASSIIVPTGSIPLSWSGATAGVNNAINKYKIFWKAGSAPTAISFDDSAEITNPSATSYTIKLNLDNTSRGKTIYTAIQTCGEMGINYDSNLKSGPSVKINSLPAAPILSTTNVKLPSTAGAYSVQVSAGSDADSSQTVKVRQGASGALQISGSQFSIDSAGTFTFYSNDGLENSVSGSTLTITRNTKPEVNNFTTAFSASINMNDKSISTAKFTDTTKKLTAAKWYIRSAEEKANVISATSEEITSGTVSNTSNSSTLTLIIDPLAQNPIVSPGYYYQIGVQLKDEYEYTAIKWSGTEAAQIYGKLPDNISIPTIQKTDTLDASLTGDYSVYYRNPQIKLEWTAPDSFPAGLSSLWYSIFYSIDAGNSWKQWGSIQSCAAKQKYTSTIDFSNAGRGDFLAKVIVYDKKDGSNQKVESSLSNKLFYSPDPQWIGNFTPTLTYSKTYTDGRNYVRPNSSAVSEKALSLSVPYPGTICTTLQTNAADLRYSILLYREGVSQGQALRSIRKVSGTENGPLGTNITYEDLQPLYTVLFGTDAERIGPYNMSIVVRFYDAFGQSIDTTRMGFVIDFREKPKQITNLKIGRDGVISNDYASVAAKKSSNTVFFPSDSASDANKSILAGEHLIIAFQKPALSYAAQVIGQYIFTLYSGDNVIYTYQTSNLISGSIYGESTMSCAIIPTSNFVSSATTFSVKIRQQDSQSYNDNISIESASSNSLCGGALEQPSIGFQIPDITSDGSKLKVVYTANTAALSWSGIQGNYNAYLREMEYSGVSYSPSCKITLQFSADNNFTSSEEIILASSSTSYNLKSGNGTQSVSLSGKCFVRLKVEYNTGLRLNGTALTTNQVVIYTATQIYFNEAPTVSYRQNSVGINCVPDNNNAFKVSMTQNNNLITFDGYGYDANNNLITHSITFDLANGQIISTNFMATADDIDDICNSEFVNARDLTY